MMRDCTARTAMRWLGYLPESLASISNTILSDAIPAGVQQWQEAISYASSNGQSSLSPDDMIDDSSTALYWYSLEEKILLYCSIVRLLHSSSLHITQDEDEDGTVDGGGDAAEDGTVDGMETRMAMYGTLDAMSLWGQSRAVYPRYVVID